MDFNVEQFVSEITWEKFDELIKAKLIQIAKYYGLEVDQKMKKQEIKNLVIDALVEENILDQTCLEKKVEVESKKEESKTVSDEVRIKQLEIQKELETHFSPIEN